MHLLASGVPGKAMPPSAATTGGATEPQNRRLLCVVRNRMSRPGRHLKLTGNVELHDGHNKKAEEEYFINKIEEEKIIEESTNKVSILTLFVDSSIKKF